MTKSRRISNRMVIFAGCLLLTIMAAYSMNSARAAGTWGAAFALTPADRGAIFPDIAVDSTGVIHVVYVETSTDLNGARIIAYTNNKSGSFSASRSLSAPLNFASDPNISVTTLNGVPKVHVTYSARTDAGSNLTTHIYYAVSTNGGTNWAAGASIAPSVVGYTPSIHVDPTGVAHIVFGGYEGLNGGQPIINIYYGTNTTGGWVVQKIASRDDGNSYNSFPAINSTYINNVITLHVMFMGQIHNGGEFGKWVYSMRKVGAGSWTAPSVRGTTAANFPKLTTLGNTVHATWQGSTGGTDIEPFYAVSADNGASWSTPVSRGTNTAPQGSRPDIARAADNSLMIVWDEGFQSTDSKTDIWSNYSPNGVSWIGATPVYKATGFSLESEVAGSCENYHAVWHDSATGVYRIFFNQTGPTTSATCGEPPVTPTPTTPPVDFTATRTSASPTKDPNVSVALSNYLGSPNQVRYSTIPFGAGDAVPAWGPLPGTNTFSLNVSGGVNDNCLVTIYVQVRNSNTSQFSAVKEVTARVDTAIQSEISIYSLQQSPFRPATEATGLSGQDNAPDGGDPYYTRDRTFAYKISQEPTGCSGVSKHTVEKLSPASPTYPYSGYGVFMDPFNENPDTNGVVYNEQAVQATVIVTDTLGNVRIVHKDLFYDDDPPILASGGTTSFPIGSNTDSLAVTMNFTASVTDDGYQNTAAADKKYWGAWIVATNSATLPSPATFQQYGYVRSIPVGATSINNVILVNGSPDMRTHGTRFVHIRFLDGAGNYTEQGITSPAITLNPNFKGIQTYLPLLRR
ncbi:MAG: hypothetical protein H0T53_09750 [Herpetosiphonaceae bacterium]|nr:hypothetical protein [Herpetosiphonaceae bacterium]